MSATPSAVISMPFGAPAALEADLHLDLRAVGGARRRDRRRPRDPAVGRCRSRPRRSPPARCRAARRSWAAGGERAAESVLDRASVVQFALPARHVRPIFAGGPAPGQPNGSSTTSAVTPSSPASSTSPGSASRRTSASPIGPSRGELTALVTRPTSRPASSSGVPGRDRRREAQAAQMAVRLALVEEARDRLLADVAALREADGALVEPGLLRDHGLVEVDAVARPPGLHARDLGVALASRRAPRRATQRVAQRRRVVGGADQVDAAVGAHRAGRAARRARPRRARAPPAGSAVGAREPRGARADQRQQPALQRALADLRVVADEAVAQRRRRSPAAPSAPCPAAARSPSPGRAGRRSSCPSASARRRKPVPGLERLHLVGDEPVQRLARVGARERELAALAAVDEDRAVAVVGSERSSSRG